MPKIDHLKVIGFLIMLVLASPALAACGNQQGAVQGTVSQAADGKPLAQAEIVVYGLQRAEGNSPLDVYQKGAVIQRQPIAEDGSYRLSLPAGSYVVEVWMGDARLGDRLVEVKAGRKTEADFEVASPNP